MTQPNKKSITAFLTDDEIRAIILCREAQTHGYGEITLAWRSGAMVKCEIRRTESPTAPINAADLRALSNN